MPGPKPTPTSQLQLRGSWRAATRPNEPQPELVTELTPPVELKGKALEVWNELAPRLVATRVLTNVDTFALVRYCHLAATWLVIMDAVDGSPKRENLLALGKCGEMLTKLEQAFGLTPADRVGIHVEQPPNGDDKSRFFERRSA